MRTIPVRWRLTIVSALTMTIVLAIAGVGVYARVAADILDAVDAGLRSQAQTVAAGIEAGGNFGEGDGLIEPDAAFAQVLTRDGVLLDGSAALGGEPLLAPETVSAISEPIFVEESIVVGDEPTPARLLAVPVDADTVLIVGASLEAQRAALSSLEAISWLGIPVAIGLTTLLAWLLAGAALRPIERMRGEASGLSMHGALDARLTVPPSRDEVARLGETLNGMLERLAETIERERRLVDDASHELRTPLGILRGELEVALRQARSEEELRTAIASGVEETDRLIALAESLLVLARFDRGSLALRPTTVVLADLVDETIASFRSRAAAAEVGLRRTGDPHVEVPADPVRIRQVVTGLIDNSLAHTPPGGSVTVQEQVHGPEVVLAVSDTGEGFDPAFLPHAFEPFARADRSRSRRSGGAGLGLAIVSAILKAHGGSVSAENATGGGAVVTCRLPLP